MLTEKTKAYVQQCYRYIEANRLQQRVQNGGLTFICDDHVVRVGVDRKGHYTFDVQTDCIVLSEEGSTACAPSAGATDPWENVDFVSIWEEGDEIIEVRSAARLNWKTQEVRVLENQEIHQSSRESLARQYVILPIGEEREVSRGIGRDQKMRLYAFQSSG